MPIAPPAHVRIDRLAPEHAAAAARLHIAGQPGTFLTSLGVDVLTAIYALLPQSQCGFGFAALPSAAENVPAGDHVERDALLGFVSATTGVGSLFAEMGLRHAGKLLPPLLARYARSPGLVVRSVQTAAYPLLVRQPDAAPGATAELLSIMVEPHQRGCGIGALLLDALLAECATRDVTHLDVTVDAQNEGARRFYTRHGFTQQRAFRLYGRDMCLYGRQIG